MLRVGIGYDIHRLGSGRKLVLGGVTIPYKKGLLGHSDGDVLIHAIIDALLGACSRRDIGYHFPDTDPEYKNASSLDLLKKTRIIISKMGRIENIDCTVVAEAPRLSDHIEKIRQSVAHALNLTVDRVSVKAKTAEGLGAVGRRQAIEAYAVALVDL